MPRRAARRAASTDARPYQKLMGLQGSIAGRWARYVRETSDLVRRRSLGPKEWTANYVDLVCAVIGDVGDWAQDL